ncbi:MAG: CHASE2 domain-containing protein [Chloroflexota bacterium]
MLTNTYRQPINLERGYHLDDYTLLEAIGRGGEAEIWSAWDNQRSKVVAVKVAALPGGMGANDQALVEFEQQAHLIASLEHPHILPLYRFGTIEGYTYFAMRYSCMGSLADLLRRGPLSIEETLDIAAQITSALSFLHTRGIVHRDLKPDNVLLDSQRHVYLSDFGLARQLGEGTNIFHTGRGTEAYASFEQHNRLGLAPQSDIYSLGILIYEMLMGKLPWEGTESLASRQYQGDFDLPDPREVNPEIPAAFMEAFRQLTAFHWTERPSTALAAYDMAAKALAPKANPPMVLFQTAVSLDEDKVVLMDAEHLLRLFLKDWQPEEEEFPARLTHLAYIDSAFTLEQGQVLSRLLNWQQFMLRGALVYDYRLSHWWQAADEAVRREVCWQTAVLEGETAVSRTISVWLQTEKTAVSLPPGVLTRLADLAVMAESWALRQDILTLLLQQTPPAEKWQPVGLSEYADKKVGHLTLRENGQSGQAVALLAHVKSETAVQTILDSGVDETVVANVLKEVWRLSGSLPAIVPFSLRARMGATLFYEQLLQDREGISIARTLIGLGIGLLMSLLLLAGVFAPFNGQTRDMLLEPYPVSGIVTIVAVDDAALAAYGRWDSWPRSLHAQLIEQLRAAGAKAIAFDVVFAAETADDDQLAAAMRAAGNVVQPILGGGDAIHQDGVMLYETHVRPNAQLTAAAVGMGHANVLHDPDGVVRQAPTVVVFEGDNGRYPSLALAALQVFLGMEISLPPLPEDGRLSAVGRTVPVGDAGEMFISFAGPPAAAEEAVFTTVSYQDVIAGSVPPERFRDKLVLVGMTATGIPDRYLTPVGGGRYMYGVEILANAIETIWSGNFIHKPDDMLRVLILLVLGVMTGLVCTRPWSGLFLAGVLSLFYLLLASVVFDLTGVLLDIFFPLLTIALSYAMVTAYRYSVEVRRRREIMGLLAARVAPEVAQAAFEGVQKGELDLKSQMQEVTVLVVDLRGYGRFVAQFDPEEVMRLVAYFRDMVLRVLLQAGGLVVSADGYQVTAVFNAPLPQPDHPWLAVEAALKLQNELKTYHSSFSTLDHPHRAMHFGCGIDTGRAVVGYAQAGEQQGYTALGDVVAIAAQLAHIALADQVLMGENTQAQVSDRVEAVKETSLSVRQRPERAPVYAVDRSINRTIKL